MPFYESREHTLEISRIDNFIYPLHLHRELEIICATEGRLLVHVDGEAYELGEGDIAFAFPNVVHGYLPLPGGTGKGIFLSFPPELSQFCAADSCDTLQIYQSFIFFLFYFFLPLFISLADTTTDYFVRSALC